MMLGVLALVALAGLSAVACAVALLKRRERSLDERLREYAFEAPEESTGLRSNETRLAESRVLLRASEAIGEMAERFGLLTRVEVLLTRADLPLRASEVLSVYVIGVLIVALGAIVLAGNPVVALVVMVMVAVAPIVFVRWKASKRTKSFSKQLPEILQLLSGALRAGFSFMQALDSVSRETEEPARKELARVVSEASLGRPPEDALDDVAARMDSEDLGWTVMAVRIQREVGGNLAEVLETLWGTMIERERLRREIRALTAEGRFSALILGLFPVVFGVIIFVAQPQLIEVLFEETIGRIALVGAAVLSALGFVWLQRIMKIEV